MSIRVAVASTDGKYINQHFGHSQMFLIFDINNEGEYEYVETRKNDPSCKGGDHSPGSLEATIDTIRDIDIVLVSQIGQGASQSLISNGIQPYIMPGFIDDKLKQLALTILHKKSEYI
jgi:nitrogen fixation protein NifX